MSCILFYSTFNQRSRDTESLMIAFRRQGHRVISLSLSAGLEIHDFLKQHDVETFSFVGSTKNSWGRHFGNLRHLVNFCRKHGVQVVYSHLEYANFIASMAQFFIKARIYICRHHTDEYKLLKIDRDLSYRLTYWLARRIIVVSEAAKKFIVEHEGIRASRIIPVNLAYDFSLYPAIHAGEVERIRKEVSADIVLITVCRLNTLKRPDVSVRVLKSLVASGRNAALILLGKGELEASLHTLVKNLGLSGKVFFPGYVSNVTEYIAASSFLVHPSISEASCVVVKEAGLVKVPAIVCRGVGDFDSYIVHGENGYLCDRTGFVEDASAIISAHYNEKTTIREIGDRLQKSVFKNFGIENIIEHYKVLNQV